MRYLKPKIIVLITLNILYAGSLLAQQAVVKATIDSTAIMIGEQTLIRMEVAGDKNKLLQLPVYSASDTIITGIEVLEMSKPDTSDLGNNRIQIKQNYLVTSFDSALYLIPPFRIISGEDTAYSNTLGLKVIAPQVDTVSAKFLPIKDVITPKFVLTDFLPDYWYWWLAGLLLVAAVIFILIRLYSKKSLIPFQKEEIQLPPHVKAINGLDDIKAQKLWQQGRIKEYHSSITDTLRIYIEERFNTPAMEMTSGEILGKIRRINETDSVYENLKQILQLADFVKFAKYQPLPDENELSLMNAYLFVNQTKPEEKPIVAVDSENETTTGGNPENKEVVKSTKSNENIEKQSEL